MRQPSVLQLKRRARQRGIGLIDAVIAMAILSFGLLGMTRLQGRMVTASTDAQLRQTAMQMADELLSTALVDTANAACYTVPAAGACASEDAAAAAEDWDTRVGAALPGTVTRRAHEVLRALEASAPKNNVEQMDFDALQEYTSPAVPSEVLEKLEALDVETLTPIEALNFLYELKKTLKGSLNG